MNKSIKNLMLGTAAAVVIIGGGVVLPAASATAAPAPTSVTKATGGVTTQGLYCRNVRIAHTKAGCDKSKQICTYYTYKYVCD
jgi:hypothetical protein